METAVDELVRHHKIGGLVFFFSDPTAEQTECARRPASERINVGAKIQLRGQNAVPTPMPSEERNLRPSSSPNTNGPMASPMESPRAPHAHS